MTTKTIKASDLIGSALDWAVAKCEKVRLSGASLTYQVKTHGTVCTNKPYSPSSDWSQGGPIIEREGLCLDFSPAIGPDAYEWMASDRSGAWVCEGAFALVAAMRCYVASKMGDTVDIPEELC